MITFDEKIDIERIPEWDKLADSYGRDKVLMFDLETTGLTPRSAFIYIIGINLWLDGQWHILQLFNDDGRSEPQMITRFMELLEGRKALFHFNGDTFDIPFVRGRMDKIRQSLGLEIPDRMSLLQSIDLLREMRPYKYALGLPNMKQKTLEQYLGIRREDIYDGGQLIGVYLSYLSSKSQRSRDLVLLHNRDDMEGMFHLSGLHALTELCNGGFAPGKMSMSQNGNRLSLCLPLSCDHALPAALFTSGGGISLRGEGTEAVLELVIRQEPCTCKVTRELKDGFFLPCGGYAGVTLYEDPKIKRMTYISADDELLGNPERMKEYAKCCIGSVMKRKKGL